MAQQIIDLGTPDQGDGESLYSGGGKINANFTELYNHFKGFGWGYYRDSEASNQTFNSTYSKLTVNGTGGTTEKGQLPLVSDIPQELWDVSTNEITPINNGDSYDLRVDLEVISDSGNPTEIDLVLDIGGGASPTIVVVSDNKQISKTAPYDLNFTFPMFSLSTYISNGGQIFVKTDTGSVTVQGRGVFIKRDYIGR